MKLLNSFHTTDKKVLFLSVTLLFPQTRTEEGLVLSDISYQSCCYDKTEDSQARFFLFNKSLPLNFDHLSLLGKKKKKKKKKKN